MQAVNDNKKEKNIQNIIFCQKLLTTQTVISIYKFYFEL